MPSLWRLSLAAMLLAAIATNSQAANKSHIGQPVENFSLKDFADSRTTGRRG